LQVVFAADFVGAAEVLVDIADLIGEKIQLTG